MLKTTTNNRFKYYLQIYVNWLQDALYNLIKVIVV